VAGWSIHNPLLYERFHLPDVASKLIPGTNFMIVD
jgi:hypothetical protein